MLTPLISYLIQIIKLQRQIILILLSQLVEIWDHSRAPRLDRPVFKRFNQFEVDEKLPILASRVGPEPLDYHVLMAEHLAKTGRPLAPIKRRKAISFESQACPRCSAPSEYLFANNGAGGQLACKVCAFRFQDGFAEKAKTASLHCPFCQHKLSVHNRRVKFDVLVCYNDQCPNRLKQIAALSPGELDRFAKEPTAFKVRYTYRQYRFELKGLAPESPIQAPVDLSRIHASPEVLGLVLTYHINYGLSARRTAAIMYDVHGVKISHQTIHNYELAVAAVIRPFWTNYPYELSDQIVGDETYIRVKGKWHYIFYFYDAKYKLILADYVSPKRTVESAVVAMNQVLQKMPEIPEDLTFVVDANPIYQVARLYFAQQGINFDIHQVIGLENKDDISEAYRYLKQTIERLNRSYKDNYRSSTGFGSATGSASYTALYSACYNFLRPHEALHYKVPVAVPELGQFERMPDKWLELIKLAQAQLPTAA